MLNPTILRSALIAIACGISLAAYARAEELKRVDVPAGDLTAALEMLAKQSGVELVYQTDQLKDLHTQGVSGEFSTAEAVTRLLEGTALTFKTDSSGAMLITVPRGSGNSEASAPASGVSQAPSSSSPQSFMHPEAADIGTEEKSGFWDRIRLAQNSDERSTDAASSQGEIRTRSSDRNSEGTRLDAVVVTGSHIRGAGNVGAPLIEIGRDDIERSGYSTTQEVIRSLPQNFGSGASEDPNGVLSGSIAGGFGSSVNLRGLGTDSTLVLLNGRRLAPSGFSADFVDVSLIPLAAVQRIEVLTDGASALYGSDAVGGVVNFVMRADYDGAETGIRLGSAQGGYEELQFTQVFGKSWSSGHALFAYDYHDRSKLASAERDFTADSDLTRFGGTNFSSQASNPGNILDASTFELIAIPSGQDGTGLTPADFTPGVVNLQNTQKGTYVFPDREQHNVFVTASQALNDAVKLFGDARYSRRRYDHRIPADNREFLFVPATNAFYVDPSGGMSEAIFGGLFVNYSFFNDFGPTHQSGDAETYGGSVGANFKLGGSWQTEVYGSYSAWNGTDRVDNVVNGFLLDVALADPDPATAFNPFGDGSNTNPATLAAIGVGFDEFTADSELWMIHAKADGDVFSLPGGAAKLAIGTEYREESAQSQSLNFRTSESPTPDPFRAGDRNVLAGFTELYLPWVTAANGRSGMRRLEMSVAARYEEYSDFDSTFDPRIGLRWSPVDGLALRGTIGSSFKAPTLSELLSQDENIVLLFPDVPDSDSSTGFTNAVLITGTRSGLQPEESKSWTFGLELRPPSVDGLDIQLSYFNIEIEDRIELAVGNFFQVLGNDEVYASVITRNPSDEEVNRWIADPGFTGCCMSLPLPPGVVIGAIIDGRTTNIATSELRGLDLLAFYGFETSIGAFNLQVAGTYLIDVKRGITPTAPLIEEVSTLFHPVDLKLRASSSWSRGDFGATATVNYIDNYMDNNPASGVRPVDAWTTVDVQFTYMLGDRFSSGLRDGISVALNIRNLFDEDPPFANTGIGVAYDAINADPLGRVVTLQVSKQW